MTAYKVYSFGDYVNQVAKIANPQGKEETGLVWFRGISNGNYHLIPSLYREKELLSHSPLHPDYTMLHYAEDMRAQHYIAKNYHFYDKLPASRVEWLEVMQHHLMKTRALDWSESSIHSLIFALEPFINREDTVEIRKKQVPSVWILHPQKLNNTIFSSLLGNYALRSELFRELKLTNRERLQVKDQLHTFKELLHHADSLESMKQLNSVVNLSVINDEVFRDRFRLKSMLCHGEMQPLFYMLSRVYSDGILLRDRSLPPLAVVQSYHSERIKAQKGVFTIFPIYEEHQTDASLRKYGLEPNGMQSHQSAFQWLDRIDLMNPEGIAQELKRNGIRDSWLYPERPVVSDEIEKLVL